LFCLAALAFVAGLGLAPESVVADKAPKADQGLVRPSARRQVPIKDYEYSSVSPFGGSRTGGADNRHYALSPDGKLLATMDAGVWQLELWDVEKAKSLGRFGRFGDAAPLAFSPDGKRLYSAGGGSWTDEIYSVEAWDVSRRRLLLSLDEGVNLTPFAAIAVSPDGKVLALANVSSGSRFEQSTPAIHFWDTTTGDEARQVKLAVSAPERYRAECLLAYSPSGRMLALVVDRRVSLIEVSTGKERCVVTELPRDYLQEGGSSEGARAVAFSPDGKALAVGCNDGVIRLYDVQTGRPLVPLVGHEERVEALRFTGPNTLLSFGYDRALLTWPLADAWRSSSPGPVKFTSAQLQQRWEDLGGGSSRKVFLAIRSLASAPEPSLPFLRKRLAPVKPIETERAKALIARLRDGDYPARRKAAGELIRMGEDVLPILSREMSRGDKEGPGSSPVLRSVASRLRRVSPTRNRLRSLRALQALEMMDGEGPRTLLATLAKGAPQANLTIEAKATLVRMSMRHVPAPDVTVEALWGGLRQEDARAAFTAIRELTARPRASAPFLAKRLLALAKRPDDEKVVARLILDLGDEEFSRREEASKALAKMGQEVVPALRAALEKSKDLEQKKRLAAALAAVSKRPVSAERLQADRALEVLHALGSEEARQTIAKLAREAQPRWLRRAAASLVAPARAEGP
jgi:WD40 repeat protein